MMSTTPSRHRQRHKTLGLSLTAVLALSAGATALPSVAADEPLPEPVVHYTMDDITDEVVPDSSGNEHHGAITGEVDTTQDADGTGALTLPGGSDGGFVTLPRDILDGAQDLTVSTRVQWAGTGGQWQWIYALGTNTERYLFSTPSNGDGNYRTAITSSFAGGEAVVTGSGSLRADDWVNLTTTLNTTDDTLTTYLNGVAVAEAATTVSAQDLLTEDAESAGFLGKSFYPDPLFRGTVGDFQIFTSALNGDQVATLVDDVPTLENLAEDTIEVSTNIQSEPVLPPTVLAHYSDGYDRAVAATWEEINPDQYATTGTFTVAGEAAGLPVTAKVTVRRGELRVDLSTNTGEFYGGASGLLYGLYADGMPTDNLIEGMNVRTVATKAQDGAQHPGSDALEVVQQLANTTDGDVYLRVTDWYRGFPYQWPGDTPQEKLDDYAQVLDKQLEMIGDLDPDVRDNLVIEPFNEPEGNMFGTGQWSLNGTSWLDDPSDYFAAWDTTYRTIKEAYPDMRIAGPGTSVLYNQIQGFLAHTVDNDTVPDIITWHELTHPESIRTSVERYRGWEKTAFAGTKHEGTELPINVNEYAFNYHTSVPGQMVQWMSAIEDSKVDAMIAFWNINGNLSDSAVQTNRGNGQWWLYNAYAQMTGHTVDVAPPFPGQNYTLQGVATLDEQAKIARTILGGTQGAAPVELVNVPSDIFGDQVRVTVREIPWTGQLGDSAPPRLLADMNATVNNGTVVVEFDGEDLPLLTESSAYEIIMTPQGLGEDTATPSVEWEESYEAEDATYTGSGYTRNGPEGSPSDVSKFYTSGGYNVGGLRTGSNGVLTFDVDVPQDGTYDLSVFANSLNTYAAVQDQGPTNVFLRVDGAQEQELFLPLGYKWVVWDHTDTTIDLTAGKHTISLAAENLDGTATTKGDALIDRIALTLHNPDAAATIYEAELSSRDGGNVVYTQSDLPQGTATDVSGAGALALTEGENATFWVYGDHDAEKTLRADILGDGQGTLTLNGHDILDLGDSHETAAHLMGGVNKITVTAGQEGIILDRVTVAAGTDALDPTVYQAEDATTSGDAHVVDLTLAQGGQAVTGIGGNPGNNNTLTFTIDATNAGTHAIVVRFSNPEQVDGTHYNPNPVARHADITVNDGTPQREMFVPTFHENNFWERTILLDLENGANTITFRSEEATNWDGETLASQLWPADYNLRADEAPIIDSLTVSPLTVSHQEEPEPEPDAPAWSATETYTAGDTVTHDGSLWKASWWTANQKPGASPYGPWQETITTTDGTAVWTPSRIFTTGDVVTSGDNHYTAKWWTRNQKPQDNTAVWEVTD